MFCNLLGTLGQELSVKYVSAYWLLLSMMNYEVHFSAMKMQLIMCSFKNEHISNIRIIYKVHH